MSNINKALQIAAKAHNTQKDKSGAAYILHPLRLMFKMETEDEMIVAILHDVVEDCDDIELEDLRNDGFSAEIIDAIDHLTNRKGEEYGDFIQRVKNNDIAIKVKLADLEDNMDVKRLNKIKKKDRKRVKKYHRAWKELLAYKK